LISLCIFIGLFLLPFLVTTWALAFSARLVGSPRGRWRVGMLAVVFIFGVDILFGVVGFFVIALMKQALPTIAMELVLLVAEFCVIFFLLRRIFGLSLARTFAPFGAYVAVIIVQFALMLGIVRPFIVEAFVIPTRGMSPTIEPGDRLIANKIISPRRWDLVVYWSTGVHPAIYCKRLIGLPGEQLRFDQGTIYINDKPVIAPPVIAGQCHASSDRIPAYQARYKDGETIALGDNEYFLICDNVNASIDSRMSGPSVRSSLVGVVDLTYWPPRAARIVR